MGDKIGYFYAMQGVVALFMPALMGIVADRWIPAQKLLAGCHLLSALFKAAMGYVAISATGAIADEYPIMILLYALSVAFFMPTLALSNSVSYTALESVKLDPVKSFPPIRVFGTIGFICTMILTDVLGFQASPNQFFLSAALGLIASGYALTLPACPVNNHHEGKSLSQVLGLNAFSLFKQRKMALFFIFSVLLGVALQITNGFANPFISHFKVIEEYTNSWGAQNANALISISQVSETLGILLIPLAMKLFGIKRVMLIAMFAWVFRFGLFGAGNPGPGVWMLILSMIVYGIAFDFFNISGALYTNMRTSEKMQNSAQGLFMLMTNGIGATVGTLSAQAVVNKFTYSTQVDGASYMIGDWSTAWYIFAGYALVVAILFIFLFKQPADPNEKVA
jgi:NHS family xanthosine MFS transporter